MVAVGAVGTVFLQLRLSGEFNRAKQNCGTRRYTHVSSDKRERADSRSSERTEQKLPERVQPVARATAVQRSCPGFIGIAFRGRGSTFGCPGLQCRL